MLKITPLQAVNQYKTSVYAVGNHSNILKTYRLEGHLQSIDYSILKASSLIVVL